MAAPKENTYWRLRSKHGRDKKFTPDELWEGASDYFRWSEETPLLESVLMQRTGELMQVPKMRAFTFKGLAIHLGVASNNLAEYEKDEDFRIIITRIREVIETQKFEGAAAGFLNPTIIARDLGLKDSTTVDVNAKVESKVRQMSDEDLLAELEKLSKIT